MKEYMVRHAIHDGRSLEYFLNDVAKKGWTLFQAIESVSGLIICIFVREREP